MIMDKCATHPNYRAVRKPSADCQKCRDIYAKARSAGTIYVKKGAKL